MTRTSTSMPGTVFLCALGLAFCLWASLGGGPELCVTAGCALYEDFSIAGISMWWIGAAGFVLLGVLAVLRMAFAGWCLAWCGLFADACLLALMLLTAPCVNCLIVAVLLVCVFLGLRRAARYETRHATWNDRPAPRQLLVLVWTCLFIANAGVALKSALPLYSLSEDPEEAHIRLFFSPSCPACRQAVEQLSGSVDVAFYPVEENDLDVARIARMEELLAQDHSMFEALTMARETDYTGTGGIFGHGSLLLRLRLLRNKAHLLMEAGPVVPFLEYLGLPRHLEKKSDAKPAASQAPAKPSPGSSSLSELLGEPSACYGVKTDCDEEEGQNFTPRPR